LPVLLLKLPQQGLLYVCTHFGELCGDRLAHLNGTTLIFLQLSFEALKRVQSQLLMNLKRLNSLYHILELDRAHVRCDNIVFRLSGNMTHAIGVDFFSDTFDFKENMSHLSCFSCH